MSGGAAFRLFKDDASTCDVCPEAIGAVIKNTYKALCLKAPTNLNHVNGLKKICTQLTVLPRLESVGIKLNNPQTIWSNVDALTDFTSDLIKSNPTTSCEGVTFLANRVSDLSVDILDGWKLLYQARSGKAPNDRRIFDLVNELAEMKESVQLKNITSSVIQRSKSPKAYTNSEELLNRFLSTHSNAITIVGSSSISSCLLDDVRRLRRFVNRFHTDNNALRSSMYLDELLQTAPKLAGGLFGIEVFEELSGSNGGGFTGFEDRIFIDEETNNRIDFSFSYPAPALLVETKNWSLSTIETNIPNVNGSFAQQFIAYVSDVDVARMDNIAYYFKNKNGVTLDVVKANFQKLYKKLRPTIVPILLNKPNMKTQLGFIDEEQAYERYDILVNDLTSPLSPLYDFIRLK